MTAAPTGGHFSRRTAPGRKVRVDVVMPFFNHGAFVDEALESVRAQTRPVDRVVLVDDGSTDDHSRQVLARLEAEPDVEVVRQSTEGRAWPATGARRSAGARP